MRLARIGVGQNAKIGGGGGEGRYELGGISNSAACNLPSSSAEMATEESGAGSALGAKGLGIVL